MKHTHNDKIVVQAINTYVERIATLEAHLRQLIRLGDDFYHIEELNEDIDSDDFESIRVNFGEALLSARRTLRESK